MLVNSKWKRSVLFGTVVVVLFVGFRLGWFGSELKAQKTPDTKAYVTMADGLIQGKGFQYDSDGRRTPGYPVFIASIYTFLGDGNTWALVFSQTVLALLTIFLFAYVTWKVFASFWLAFGAAMLLSIDPAVSALERYILSENLTIFLSALTLFLAVQMLFRPTYLRAGILGLIIGALVLTRPNFFLFPVIILVMFWLAPRVSRFTAPKPGEFAILILCLLILPAMWVFRNHQKYGILMASQVGFSSTQHVGGFLDSVEFSGDIERTLQEIYLRYRSERLRDTGVHANTVYYALEEMKSATGMNGAELSEVLFRMSREAAIQHPVAYYDSIKAGWGQFWQPALWETPEWMQKSLLIWVFVEVSRILVMLFAVLVIIFLSIVAYRKSIPYFSQQEFILFLLFLLIMTVAATSSLSELAENHRLRIPIQPFITLWLLWGVVWLKRVVVSTRSIESELVQ